MSAPSVERYFNATSALVADFLRNLRADDPAGYRRLQVAAAGGAVFKLETGFSTAGIIDCKLFVIDPAGNSLEIGSIEVQNHVPN
ncbi:MAG TPA: hypothetical protein PLN31_19385 [Azoarcus taiwanensis]|nr:hypothetical protein [Azoarcus taiwanensis]